MSSAYAQRPPSKVVVDEARLLEAPSTITLVGTVDAARRSRVAPAIAGRVMKVPIREGDLVVQGGILCKLNDETLTLQLAEARAKRDARIAAHAELLAGTRREELQRLKALVDEASAEYERWKKEMARVEKLYAGRDANAKEVYDTRADMLGAKYRLLASQASYDLGVEGPRKEVIAQAAHEVAEQRAIVQRLKGDLRKKTIRAPFAGYVSQRLVEVGEWVAVGANVAELIDLSSVLVRVDVPEYALPFLVVGDAVRVKVDALRRTFEGHVKHIIRQADPTARTFPVEIEVDNTQGTLASGMFARATVTAGPKKTVVAVPKDAIVEREGISYLAIAVPGERGGMMGMLQSVTVGVDVGDWITITSGNVRPGARVITRGTENMLPFPTPVAIVDQRGTPVSSPSEGPDHLTPPEQAETKRQEKHEATTEGGSAADMPMRGGV